MHLLVEISGKSGVIEEWVEKVKVHGLQLCTVSCIKLIYETSAGKSCALYTGKYFPPFPVAQLVEPDTSF